MKNILILHYDLHFYRIPIYNKLSKELKKHNINLIIWPEKILQDENKIEFNYLNDQLSFKKYKHILSDYKIDAVINFLQPRSPSFKFYFQMIFYTYIKSIPLIYYGHGLNLSSTSKILDFMYNFLHLFYKSIILYTPNEINKLWNIHHKKIEIAYNTLDLDDRDNLIHNSKQTIRTNYNLKDEFVILFSGRIEKRKKLNVLIDFINREDIKNIKLIVVGPTKDEDILNQFNNNSNILYLGPIYDTKQMAEIFYISDLFSIPGHIGLGLVEALYWGLPIITLNVKHAPEIYYLKNNYNGFILDNIEEFETKLLDLSSNPKLLKQLSINSKNTYNKQAGINNMINGFINSFKKVLDVK